MAASETPLRIGAIGIDSSHLPEFTRRIHALNDAGRTRCRVVAMFDPGDHQLPAADVAKWRADTLEMGVRDTESMDELLDAVDGVMVLTVSGHTHTALAEPALRRGLATYVDKPLTCDLTQAKRLLETARRHGARCYSASSLRFAAEIATLDREALGKLQVISAFGPGELNPAMAGLFFYGVHTIELVDALWGPGVASVAAVESADRDLVELRYHDGRFAQLRLERKGCYDFGATVHGDKGVASFKVDFSDVYNRFAASMAKFFEGGEPPVSLRDIVENVAVMEAGNRSMAKAGSVMDVEPIA